MINFFLEKLLAIVAGDLKNKVQTLFTVNILLFKGDTMLTRLCKRVPGLIPGKTLT